MNLKLVIAAGLVVCALSAQAQLVDFEDLNNNGTSGYTLWGPSVQSRGFQFDSIFPGGGGDELASWTADIGTPYTGSVALFANYGDDEIMMTKVGGGAFTLRSIDLSDVFNSAGTGMTVSFEGTRADSSTVTESFVLNPSDVLSTYAFSNMTNMVKVRMYDDNVGDLWFQLDNVNVVPEPATMIAMGAGIAALLRRRRK